MNLIKTNPANNEQPPITDIDQSAQMLFKETLGRKLWLIIMLGVIWSIGIVGIYWNFNLSADVLGLAILPWIGLLYYYQRIRQRIYAQFWQQFAKSRRWRYEERGDPLQEKALLFRQGRRPEIHHVTTGTVDGRRLRIFAFQFTLKKGKQSVRCGYIVFEFTTFGYFPHLYLNRRSNSFNYSAGVSVSLPSEFEEFFTLSAPRQYEIEALQIFTPNVLAYLLDSKLKHDLELVDQELLMFVPGQIKTRTQLETEYKTACDLMSVLAPVLDRIKFSPVGDLTHRL